MKNLLILSTLFVGLLVSASHAENGEYNTQTNSNSVEAAAADENSLTGMESAQNSPWDPRDTVQTHSGSKDAGTEEELRNE